MNSGVEIIIVNWNGWRTTLRCLRSLDALDYRPQRTTVVDNGSTDGSEARIRQERPDVEIVQTGANLGYAGGNNAGLRRALERATSFVWILNNDGLPEPAALRELLACMDTAPQLGVLASRVSTVEGAQQVGLAFSTTAARDWDFVGRDYEVVCAGCVDPGDYHDAAIVAGPSLLLRTDALRDVGFFDERYFHFFEEMDLVERIRRAGWKVGLSCRSTVVHEHGATLANETPQALYYMYRNHLLYRQKLFGVHPLRVLAHKPLRRLRNLLSLRRLARGDFRLFLVNWWAITDALRGRAGRRDLGPSYRQP